MNKKPYSQEAVSGVRSEYVELRKTLPDISGVYEQKYRQGVQIP